MRHLKAIPKGLFAAVTSMLCIGLLLAPHVFASGWTASNLTSGTTMSGHTWTPLVMSGSGKYMLAYSSLFGIYASNNYGANWASIGTDTAAMGSLQSMTMSYSGQYVVAAGQLGDLWLSTDYGVHWTNETTGSSLSGLNWQEIISSTTGQYVAATSTVGLYTSSDFGAHWKNVSSGTLLNGLGLNDATISSDGKYLTVDNGANVFGSHDYGVTWTKINDPSLDGAASYALTASSDGKNIFSGIYGGDIYVSHDYGVTWTNLTTGTAESGLPWLYLMASPTGEFIVGALDSSVSGGGVYVSSDAGATWANLTGSITPSGQIWDVPTISASGQYVLVNTDNADIYVFNNPSLKPAKPLLVNRTVSVNVNSSMTVNVLNGASGYDADTLKIISGPSHGVAVDPPGDITYTPSKGYTGSDSLIYQLCATLDDTVCSQATLSFTVATSPDTGFGTPRRVDRPVALIGVGAVGSLGVSGCLFGWSRKLTRSRDS